MVFQPHLYSRTRHLAHEFGEALTAADAVCVTAVYAAREEPVAGVTGKLVVDALAERSGRDALAGRRRSRTRRRSWPDGLAPATSSLTVGAGDVDRTAPLILAALAGGGVRR